MDGFASTDELFFLCTTNHLEGIEPAIVARPGRIDQIIEVPKPTAELRRRLLIHYTQGLKLEANLERWVNRTENFSAAAMHELVKKAGSRAALAEEGSTKQLVIRDTHLESAWRQLDEQLRKIRPPKKGKKQRPSRKKGDGRRHKT